VFGLSIDPAAVIAIAVMLLFGFPVHEFSHALAAYRLGDGTAKMFGRLTLNPIVHFDPIGGGLLVLSGLFGTGFFFGWAKPTPVNPMNLEGGRRGEAVVALAGPASNIILAAAAAIPLRFILGENGMGLPTIVIEVLFYFIAINVFLAIFNLIPIPPLDGYRVLLGLISPQLAWQIRPVLEQYGIFILLIFLFTVGGRIIGSIGNEIVRFLVGI
jgi:Zn-dependent protease